MRIYAGEPVTGIADARNTLTQRTVGPRSRVEVKLDVSGLNPGARAGISAFQSSNLCLGVEVTDDAKELVLRENSRMEKDKEVYAIPMNGDDVWLRIDYCFTPAEGSEDEADTARVSYSFDGENWTSIDDYSLKMRFTLDYFTGYRTALYCYSVSDNGGYADFDYFHQTLLD